MLAGVVASLIAVAPGADAKPHRSAGDTSKPAVLVHWVEAGPRGAIVRVITTARVCPQLTVTTATGSAVQPMQIRAQPSGHKFPNRVCEATLPRDAQSVTIDGQTLKAATTSPKRIVVIGDTGCRDGRRQRCADDWDFPALARHAAQQKPDLVIHVGDYNYRGATCPKSKGRIFNGCCTYDPKHPSACGAADCGDNWDNWNADFFTPARPLLDAAPWVVVRGNHELCSRVGHGWFRYLDPQYPPQACDAHAVETVPFTAPYAIDAGLLRFIVLDSSDACDDVALPDQVNAFKRQSGAVSALAASAPSNVWLIGHRPLWWITAHDGAVVLTSSATLQPAFGNALPSKVKLALAGHRHLFEALTFRDAPTASLIVGNGGAELASDDVPASFRDVSAPTGSRIVSAGMVIKQHGYLLLTLSPTGWTGTLFSKDDQPLATCNSDVTPVCTAADPHQ